MKPTVIGLLLALVAAPVLAAPACDTLTTADLIVHAKGSGARVIVDLKVKAIVFDREIILLGKHTESLWFSLKGCVVGLPVLLADNTPPVVTIVPAPAPEAAPAPKPDKPDVST